MCSDFYTTSSKTFLIVNITERDMIKCILLSKWSTLYCCQILMKMEFSWRIFDKIFKYQTSWKSVQWQLSCSIGADGQSDMTKLRVDFLNFVKAPNKREEQRTDRQTDRSAVTPTGRCADQQAGLRGEITHIASRATAPAERRKQTDFCLLWNV